MNRKATYPFGDPQTLHHAFLALWEMEARKLEYGDYIGENVLCKLETEGHDVSFPLAFFTFLCLMLGNVSSFPVILKQVIVFMNYPVDKKETKENPDSL